MLPTLTMIQKSPPKEPGKSREQFLNSGRRIVTTTPPLVPVDLPIGIRFIAMGSNSLQYFIPSPFNFFGGIQIQKLKVDSNTGILLYFDSLEVLKSLTQRFSKPLYRISIGGAPKGTPFFPYLEIKCSRGPLFSVQIAHDIMPSNPPSEIDSLKFALCTQDLIDIYSHPELADLRIVLSDDMKWIQNLVENKYYAERRTCALFGQAILHQFRSHSSHNLLIFYDHTFADCTLRQLEDMCGRLCTDITNQSCISVMPSKFIFEMKMMPNCDQNIQRAYDNDVNSIA
jgi:hypothetical protein